MAAGSVNSSARRISSAFRKSPRSGPESSSSKNHPLRIGPRPSAKLQLRLWSCRPPRPSVCSIRLLRIRRIALHSKSCNPRSGGELVQAHPSRSGRAQLRQVRTRAGRPASNPAGSRGSRARRSGRGCAGAMKTQRALILMDEPSTRSKQRGAHRRSPFHSPAPSTQLHSGEQSRRENPATARHSSAVSVLGSSNACATRSICR